LALALKLLLLFSHSRTYDVCSGHSNLQGILSLQPRLFGYCRMRMVRKLQQSQLGEEECYEYKILSLGDKFDPLAPTVYAGAGAMGDGDKTVIPEEKAVIFSAVELALGTNGDGIMSYLESKYAYCVNEVVAIVNT
jgi:hypothetical protein